MNYCKLGEDIYIPQNHRPLLTDAEDIKFNYYMSSRVNGKKIDLDITSKIFGKERMYVKKSCYRVKLGEIEDCVKKDILDHMRKLGVREQFIPESLLNCNAKTHLANTYSNRIYSD